MWLYPYGADAVRAMYGWSPALSFSGLGVSVEAAVAGSEHGAFDTHRELPQHAVVRVEGLEPEHPAG